MSQLIFAGYSDKRPGRPGWIKADGWKLALTLVLVLLLHAVILVFLLFHRRLDLTMQPAGRAVSSVGVEVTLVAAPPVPVPVVPVVTPPQKPAPRPPVVRRARVLASTRSQAVQTVKSDEQATARVSPETPEAPAQVSAVVAPSLPAPVVPMLNLPGATAVKNVAHLACQIPQPAYPGAARRLGHEGTVTLNVTIGISGRVEHADVAVSSGFDELDEAAVDAVSRGQCQPYVENGFPRAATARQPISFHLDR